MMNTIRTYIDGLFAELPDSPEVNRAHGDLLHMSEDKYHELLGEGLSDSEATGRVITEFGNLDDLADDLGIRAQFDRAAADPGVPTLTASEVEGHLRGAAASGWLIGAGVFVILAGLAVTVLLSGLGLDEVSGVPVLVAGAIGVGLFIFGGRQMREIDDMRHRRVRVESAVVDDARRRLRRGEGGYTAALVIGVGLIILSVAIPSIVAQVGGEAGEPFGAIGLFIVLGVGIATLVIASLRRNGLRAVETAGTAPSRSEREAEEASLLIGRIAAVYWPLVVLVFLAWSFIGNAWHISWIVYPLAGVGFAVVVGVLSFVRPKADASGNYRSS